MVSIWCGDSIDADDDGASFLFLAKRDGSFWMVDEWADQSLLGEGRQFYSHFSCFWRSLPEEHRLLLDDD